MSSDVAIKVENLSKCYHIYDNPRDRLKQFIFPRLARILNFSEKQYFREFWALKDVSFEIKKGETIGIIGRNGSGKSTLLQMICGTLNPTVGTIKTNGRISALLELGSGFNPEFTGRENVYLNGAVLGLSNKEISHKFEDILAFSEIGEFIDQPVKTYSSGMIVRLAFSVAINVNPEILVVDEALAVGDELFQRKCFSKIETIKKAGTTVLFVSHSGAQIIDLCDRAILLDGGEKILEGLPKKAVGLYHKLLYAPPSIRNEIRDNIKNNIEINNEKAPAESYSAIQLAKSSIQDSFQETYDESLVPNSTIVYESHGALIGEPKILNERGEQVNGLVYGKEYRYIYRVEFVRTAMHVKFGMLINTTTGTSLGGALTAVTLDNALPLVEKGQIVTVEFTFRCSLNPGVYFMNAGAFGCAGEDESVLHRKIDALAFRVLPIQNNTSTGIVNFDIKSKLDVGRI
jgi:lipopolysaccharide transport system ATP-binding protein